MVDKRVFEQTAIYMDTLISIKLITAKPQSVCEERVDRAFNAFSIIEQHCSRFDPNSELSQLSLRIGQPQKVSALLYQAIHFAREMAELTNGVFDPTIGQTLEDSGFNKNYLTGERIKTNLDRMQMNSKVDYHSIILDPNDYTVTLLQPLLLDLGAVAKGFAVDLAAKELQEFEGFYIDAGGDIYAHGLNEQEKPWTVGIRHPYHFNEIVTSVPITDAAICTSGSYERVSQTKKDTHHLINPTSKESAKQLVSCTVMAPFAMLADAFSTSVFILGKEKGIQLLEENNIEGFIMTPTMETISTRRFGER